AGAGRRHATQSDAPAITERIDSKGDLGVDERVRGDEADEGLDVAIVGMSGRFPGAQDVEELWDHIAGGRESIHQFSDDELRRAGVRADFLSAPDYVKAKGVLRDPSGFDAGLFGFLPREAALIDPQQRVF